MNPILFLYLTLFRAPKILAERQKEEDERKRKQLEEDRKNGKIAPDQTCKKCDEVIEHDVWRKYQEKKQQYETDMQKRKQESTKTTKDSKQDEAEPLVLEEPAKLCKKCMILAFSEQRMQANCAPQELQMTPFLWLQVFIIFLGLSVFIYRNFTTQYNA